MTKVKPFFHFLGKLDIRVPGKREWKQGSKYGSPEKYRMVDNPNIQLFDAQ